MKFKLQLFGGGGGGSGGDFKFTGHKMPDTGKPNSSRTRYDKKGEKRERRYYDKDGIVGKMCITKVHQIINIHTNIIGGEIQMANGIELHMKIG